MKYQAVVFDLDGTLLDTLEGIADAMNHVLQEHGWPAHPVQAYRRFIGGGMRAQVRHALPASQRQEEMITECLVAYRRTYNRLWQEKTRPYPGIPELLNTLTDKHIKMAVLTNKPQRITELCIQAFFPDETFTVIQGQRDHIPLKPDPAGSLDIAERLRVSPRACVFVGDSEIDIQTAVHAGMFPVGVLWGYRPEQELREHGAQAVIQHPGELLNILQ
jgi:phosphoglycolate phosphatase